MTKNASDHTESDVGVGKKHKSILTWLTTSTSMEWLAKAEEKMLSIVKCGLSKRYIRIFNNSAALWTVTANTEEKKKTPLVLVHGYGSGVGMWCMNFDELSQDRALYTFDLLGFGRSSRITFPKSAEKVEEKFIESIEDWRKQENIDEFHLLGHSFGGFLVGCYALKYPQHVKSLVFADPWGFPETNQATGQNGFVRWGKSLHHVLKPFSPLSQDRQVPTSEKSVWLDNFMKSFGPYSPFTIMRVAGSWGPKLIERFKDDYKTWFKTVGDKQEYTVYHYIYHCNSFKPSGEKAFNRINKSIGYDRLPMISRISGLRPGMPVTFIFGAKSYILPYSGFQAKEMLNKSDVAVYLIEDAGHHLHAEKPDEFNDIVNSRCNACDD